MKVSGTDRLVFLVVILVVVFDQLSKFWVRAVFHPYEVKAVVPGFFNLVLAFNTGAAFGFLSGEKTLARHLFFVTVAVIALVVLVVSYRYFKEQGKVFAYSIGLIGGGAIGNLIDRLRHGAVTDFLDFYINSYHWPAFNVADSAITVGVALFLLGTWFDERKKALPGSNKEQQDAE